MTNLIKSASQEMRGIIMSAMGVLVANGSFPAEALPAFNIEIPADKTHGDFATNAAMVLAKPLKMPPRKIAELICSEAVLDGSCFSKCEIAGPGFINFFLSQSWFSNVVSSVLSDGNNYGRTSTGNGKKILVEFVSANPTGPMHIGNARGGAIGDCLASVLDWAGYEVAREFYVNDAGNQVEKFGKSLFLRFMQICSAEGQSLITKCPDNESFCQAIYDDAETFPMPEDVYLGVDIIAHAKNYYDANGSELSAKDESEIKTTLSNYALPLNIEGLERDLKKYNITYDTWFRESVLHNNGDVMKIVELLKERGYTYEQDGAIWFQASKFGDDKDRVLVRANGIPTYFVPDIAYHYNKLVTRGYDIAIDVLGADHHGYIPRMRAALTALGIDPSRLDIVIMQMVRLVRNGETVKLSKRSGKAITLSTLLDEVPISAARFFFNLRESNSQFDFDLDLAIEQSSQNPVYYVQYAHARICSIISNLAAEGISAKKLSDEQMNVLTQPEEIALIRYIASLPNEIDTAARDYDPSKITRYSVEIATLFHKFYTACRVKGESEEILQARLSLCNAAKIVIKNTLDILKVDAPEQM